MNSRQSFDDAAEAEKTCDPDRRNRYFRHRHLTAADNRLEQVYGIERRRLINRTITGWGVARGFALSLHKDDNGTLRCGSGLAFDSQGRELVRRKDAAMTEKEIVLLDKHKQPSEAPQNSPAATYLLQVHYAERRQAPVRSGNSCYCGQQEWNYVSETVIFSLLPLPDPAQPSDVARPACGHCGCAQVDGPTQGRHACLCDWTNEELASADDTGTWNGDVCYRLGAPVPLAIVSVSFDHCKHARFHTPMDACTPRRIIKTNDTLFDLIRGCDLTRIENVSWAGWHNTTVKWDTFSEYFPDESDDTVDPLELGRTTFEITFTKPVLKETLTPACLSFKVLYEDSDSGWLKVRHVLVTALLPGDITSSSTTRNAFLQVAWAWNDDEIRGRKASFCNETRVEIEIRGDLIFDCNGLAVDASCTAGPDRLPSGNGTPGGTYLICFTLEPKPKAEIPPNNQRQATRTPS